MKKQITLLLLTLIITVTNLLAAPRFDKGEKVNVWALKGLSLYKQPGTGSAKILTIPYGKSVSVLSSKTDSLKAGQIKLINIAVSSTVKGYWIKVSYNGKEGYVFDGYLSKMPCLKVGVIGAENMDAYLKRIHNDLTFKTVKKDEWEGTTTYYLKGKLVLKIERYDGCIDEDIYLDNITDADLALFKYVYFREADAVQDLKTVKLKNGRIKVSFASCT